MSQHQPLVEYFRRINQSKTVKGSTMFDNVKASMQLVRTKFTELFAATEPQMDEIDRFKAVNKEDGYWAFESFTPEYTVDGELEPMQHDVIFDTNDTTWMECLDQILDVLGKHYGYNIKEQVYYSVAFPVNEVDEDTGKQLAGYGRCLNDAVLQKLLLAYPEAYKFTSESFEWKKL